MAPMPQTGVTNYGWLLPLKTLEERFIKARVARLLHTQTKRVISKLKMEQHPRNGTIVLRMLGNQ
jgi:hypothetical protein